MAGTAGSGLGSEPVGFACCCVWARPMAGSAVIGNSSAAQHGLMGRHTFGLPARAKEGVSLIIWLSTWGAPVSVRSILDLLHMKAPEFSYGDCLFTKPDAQERRPFQGELFTQGEKTAFPSRLGASVGGGGQGDRKVPAEVGVGHYRDRMVYFALDVLVWQVVVYTDPNRVRAVQRRDAAAHGPDRALHSIDCFVANVRDRMRFVGKDSERR